ncbi:LysR substrate-binding domain-containing protein, partial [Salmonella enterica subsp. enterica serovar Virginia]|nr:LysR substrate-binding domain-containing protein [Salmonella enterica subsp. enterica serovar Virginia]
GHDKRHRRPVWLINRNLITHRAGQRRGDQHHRQIFQHRKRHRIELWFRRHKISNPQIYATVGGHEAMVSMVALGCGVALLPEV